MEHAINFKTTDVDSFYLASLVFQDVHETLHDIHAVVAALLRYAQMGASIANCLIEWSATPTSNEV